MSDEETEKVRITSLDESFDADMRATMAGPEALEPAPPAPLVGELLGYVRDEYGVERLEARPSAPAGTGLRGFLGRVARKLFVSRTYHASLVTAISELEERNRALEARLDAFARAERDYDAVLARTLFKLWGDYNHVVRVVLEHHINVVTRHQLDTVMPHVEERLDDLAEAVRGEERRATARLEELTDALRALETRLGEIEGPHDRAVASVAELIAELGREESLARRLEVLEARDKPAGEG